MGEVLTQHTCSDEGWYANHIILLRRAYGVLIQSFAGLALSLEDDLRLRRGI